MLISEKSYSPSWRSSSSIWLAAVGCFLFALSAVAQPTPPTGSKPDLEPIQVRIAVFNVWELGVKKIDQVDDAGLGAHPQLLAAAEVIRRVRPDILLLNEIDYDWRRSLAEEFNSRYLSADWTKRGSEPIDYPHIFSAPVNTGVPSGLDLNNDGETDSPDDGWGFGRYPGQYGMALLSRWPIDDEALRSFRALRWITMPGHLMPDGRGGRPAWYDAEEAALLRLSSKSFWDVPVDVAGHRLHILASHPTPPVFDGEEDRNGRRNFDEIRLVADYLDGEEWMVDDQGRRGGLEKGASCLVMGDLNADPLISEAPYGRPAIAQLLEHARLRDPRPRSEGDLGVSQRRGPYPGDSKSRTASFGRIDYVLPSRDLNIVDSGVFLPPTGDPLRALVEGDDRASDHLLVWVDISLEPRSDR